MHSLLRRTIGRLAKTVLAPQLHGPYLFRQIGGVPTQTTLGRTSLHARSEARAAELVDTSQPLEGPLLEKPEEPGPEDCCQVWLGHWCMQGFEGTTSLLRAATIKAFVLLQQVAQCHWLAERLLLVRVGYVPRQPA